MLHMYLTINIVVRFVAVLVGCMIKVVRVKKNFLAKLNRLTAG